MPPDDIPLLTLRVLERIQAELVDMKGEIVEMKGEIVQVKGELKLLGARFDHFLGFVGRDVQDLKARMTVVEDHLGIGRTR